MSETIRETREAIRVMGIVGVLWARLGYRPWSRLLHRFGLHYAPERPGPERSVMRWCQWCGLRDVRYRGGKIG